jgi:hypothetical protein
MLRQQGQADHDLQLPTLGQPQVADCQRSVEQAPRLCVHGTAWELGFSVFGFGLWFELGFPFCLLQPQLHGFVPVGLLSEQTEGGP